MQFEKEQIGDGDMVLHYGAILLFTEATGFPKLNGGCVMLFVHIGYIQCCLHKQPIFLKINILTSEFVVMFSLTQ